MHLSSLLTSLRTALVIAATLPLPSASAPAPDRTTEEGEAQITDPIEECTPYTYPPVSDAMTAGKFPPIWAVADILANDANALAKYQSIQSKIPNIPPNGHQPQSIGGDFSGFNYPSNDPNCWWTNTHCTTPKITGLASDLIAAPEPNTLGYGFDDGPSCSHNVFYNFLQQNNQTASMFYIGSNIVNYPLEAQRALADGHEICVRKYTWSHSYTTALTNTQVFAEFYYTMEMIKLVIGVTPTCWRPPYGDVDDRVRAIAQALGLRNILWSYDSSDWRAGSGNFTNADVDVNYQALVTAAQQGTFDTAGTIMLTHEIGNATMSEAIKWYPQLKNAFKYIVPMGVATNVTHPYVETEYLLPTFEQYISGTTTLEPTAVPSTTSSSVQATPTSSFGSSTSQSQTTSGVRRSFGASSGLVVSAALMGMLRLMM
ncbi:carbohydrate esterase family 4 protein [Boletus coccyginus]|nr:carbohydrate esterase family 4 protein [Boletus coccyginus]